MEGAKEKIQLEVAGSYGTDGEIDLDKLNENLLNMSGIEKYNKDGESTKLTKENPIEGLPVELKIEGYIFEISEKGIVNEKGIDTGLDPTPEPPVEDEAKPGEIVKESNKKYTDADGDTAVIPVGFTIVPGLEDISEGLVISDNASDTEKEEVIVAEGNQFVWIPVKDAEDYARKEEYHSGVALDKIIPDENYLPTGVEIPDGKTEQEVEKDLVTKEGIKGFYISRYEAGDSSAQTARTSAKEGTLVSKKGMYVYNYIKHTDDGKESGILGAKEKSKKFINDEHVKSGLCTGIQWDIIMEFINGKNDGKNQSYDVKVASDSRHIKSIDTTGQNLADKVCNIYDLEGNCFEHIAEQNTEKPSLPYIVLGGSHSAIVSASYRSHGSNDPNSNDSFRFVLYVM